MVGWSLAHVDSLLSVAIGASEVSVYVSDMPFSQWAYLYADTEQEVEAMADALGVVWSMRDSHGVLTYRLNGGSRDSALEQGAILLDLHGCARKMRELRSKA